MSKKSRARARAKLARKQTVDSLALQKKNIKSSSLEYLALTVAYFLLALLLSVAPLWERARHAWIFLFIMSATMAFFAIMYAIHTYRRFRIAHIFKPVRYASEENITFSCQKIAFLERYRYRYKTYLLCVVFYSKDGQVFYYVYPDGGEISTLAEKELKQRLVGATLELPCYFGTTIIKEFDPYKHILE